MDSSISTVFKAVDEISPVLAKWKSSLNDIVSSLDQVDKKLNGLKMNDVGNIGSKSTTSALDSIGKSAENATQKVSGISEACKGLRTTGSVLSGVGKGLATVGKLGMGVTTALGAMTAGAVKTAVGFDQIYQSSQIIFERMLGGEQQAKQLYNDLYGIAKNSAFPIENFLEASKQLVGVGVSAENTKKYMQAMTDAVSAFGGNKEHLDQMAFAIRRVATNGRVSMKEINMMADDGINALQILGNHYGKTAEEMRDMISEEFVPAEEALDAICKGIEEGSDGIAGATQAMGGMAQKLKLSTLQGVFDSLHTSIRTFCLDLLGMDDRTDEGKHRVEQFMAVVTTLNNIITSSAPIFKSITESFGKFLDKLVGANPTYDEATGQWTNLDGALGKLHQTLQTMDPDKAKRIGDAILRIGMAAPVLYGVGKTLLSVGQAMEKLGRHKEVLEGIVSTFQKLGGIKMPELKMPTLPKRQKTPKITDPSRLLEAPKITDPSQILPSPKNLSNAYSLDANGIIDKFKALGQKLHIAGKKAGEEATDGLESGVKKGSNKFFEMLSKSFAQGQVKARASLDNFKTDVKTQMADLADDLASFNNYQGKVSSKTGITRPQKSATDIYASLKNSDDEQKADGLVKRIFKHINESVNKEGLSFGANIKKAITDNLPSGDGIGNKTKSIFTNLGKSSKEVGKAGLGIVKAIIPDNIQEAVATKLGGVVNLAKGATGKISGFFSSLATKISPSLSSLVTNVGSAFTYISTPIQGLLSYISPLIQAIGGIVGPVTGLGTAFASAGVAVVGVTAGIGLLTGMLGKLGGATQNAEGVFEGVMKVSNIFTTINSNIANFTGLIVGKIREIVNEIVTMFPTYAKVGGQMIAQFVTGILTTIPQIITAGAQIAIEFITGVIRSLPSLIQGGFLAIQNFIIGMQNNWPLIEASVGQMVSDIWTCLQTNWPKIVEGGKGIVRQLVDGMSALLPKLWEVAVGAFTWLWNGLISWLPQIGTFAGNLIGNLVGGIIQLSSWLVQTGWSIITWLVGAIWDHKWDILNTGGQIILALIQGIGSLLGALIQTVWNLGSNIVMGIWNGIQSAWTGFVGWFNDTFSGLIEWVRNLFGIHSPSTVFIDFGTNIIQGLVNGLQSAVDNLWGTITGIFNRILHPFGEDAENDQVDYTESITKAQEQLAVLQQTVEEGFAAIEERTRQLTQTLSETIVASFSTMTSQILAQTDVMVLSLPAHLMPMVATFSGVFTAISTNTAVQLGALSSIAVASISALIASISMQLGQLAAVIVGAFTGLVIAGQTALNSLKGSVMQIITEIKNYASIAFTELVTNVGTQYQTLVDTNYQKLTQLQVNTQTIIAALNATITTSFASMKATIETTFATIDTNVTSKLNEMTNSITTSINTMNASVMASMTSFEANYNAVWNRLIANSAAYANSVKLGVLDQFYLMHSWMKYYVLTAANTILSYLSQLRDLAADRIRQLVSKVCARMNPLPNKFKTYGEQMMDGLAQGIKAKQQTVIDATNELVKQLKDTFIKGLGIHSPSKFMHYIGEMMAAGLMGGLSNSQLSKFAKNTLNDIVSAFEEGKFNAHELVDFVGRDTLKVIEAIEADPELAKRASVPGVMNFGATGGAANIVDAARKYIGYTSNGFDSIFGQRLGLSGAWCAYFVKCMADEAGVAFPNIYNVPGIWEWAHQNGRWTTSPQVGDAVIYGGGQGHHIEIVSAVNGDGSVTSIGGNTGLIPGVYEHTRRDINGFVRLDGSNGGQQSDTIAYPLIGTKGTQTSWFGNRAQPTAGASINHGGVDLAAPMGTGIASALAGMVTLAGVYGGYGNAVIVQSGDIDIIYGHMSRIMAQQGQQVGKGQQIGQVGSTGISTGPHLHFEMHQGGNRIDPQPYIDGSAVSIGLGGGTYAMSLLDQLKSAYNQKYGTNLALSSGFPGAYTNVGAANMDVTGSGLLNPGWFQQWTPPAAVARWTPQVQQVLAMLGQPQSLLKGVLWAINGESSGDPNSTYLGDQNIIYGGSKGLLQTITPNFERWKNPSLPNNIYDPMQNIWVCLREMMETYGGIANLINRKIAVGHWFGYAVGTRNVPEDMFAMIHEGEAILPKTQNPYSQSGGNYLKEIGDQIGLEVISTLINPEVESVNGVPVTSLNYDGIDYRGMNESLAMEGVTKEAGNSDISLVVNIDQINTEDDYVVVENKIVDTINSALKRAHKATGAVKRV